MKKLDWVLIDDTWREQLNIFCDTIKNPELVWRLRKSPNCFFKWATATYHIRVEDITSIDVLNCFIAKFICYLKEEDLKIKQQELVAERKAKAQARRKAKAEEAKKEKEQKLAKIRKSFTNHCIYLNDDTAAKIEDATLKIMTLTTTKLSCILCDDIVSITFEKTPNQTTEHKNKSTIRSYAGQAWSASIYGIGLHEDRINTDTFEINTYSTQEITSGYMKIYTKEYANYSIAVSGSSIVDAIRAYVNNAKSENEG